MPGVRGSDDPPLQYTSRRGLWHDRGRSAALFQEHCVGFWVVAMCLSRTLLLDCVGGGVGGWASGIKWHRCNFEHSKLGCFQSFAVTAVTNVACVLFKDSEGGGRQPNVPQCYLGFGPPLP